MVRLISDQLRSAEGNDLIGSNNADLGIAPSSDFAFGSSNPKPLYLEANDATPLKLPSSEFVTDATYIQEGMDLHLQLPDGREVVIEGYFAQSTPPDLIADGNITVPPQLVDSFLMPLATGQTAQVIDGGIGDPIGSIEFLSGTIVAVRADGTRVELKLGDPVYQGDQIQTNADGSIKMRFVDDTIFTLGENARLALDELVYDSSETSGSSAFSILKGSFVFVSGQIAHDNYDNMAVSTPVATIGIRGTTVTGSVLVGDVAFTFSLLEGAITITSGDEVINLTESFDTAVGQTDSSGVIRIAEVAATPAGILGTNKSAFEALGEADLQRLESVIEKEVFEQTGEVFEINLREILDVVEEDVELNSLEEALKGTLPPDETEGEIGEELPLEEDLDGALLEGEPPEEELPIEEEIEEALLEEELVPEELPPEGQAENEEELTEEEIEALAEELSELETASGETEEFEEEITQILSEEVIEDDDFILEDDNPEVALNTPPAPEEITPTLDDAPEPTTTQETTTQTETASTDVTNVVDYSTSSSGVTKQFSETVAQADVVTGSAQSDTIGGGAGNDTIDGGGGDDVLDGGTGNDSLLGGEGNDTVGGGVGDDTIIGGTGAGDDFYDGGEGEDLLEYPSVVGTFTVEATLGVGVVGTDSAFGTLVSPFADNSNGDVFSTATDGNGQYIDNDVFTNMAKLSLGSNGDLVKVQNSDYGSVLDIDIDGKAGNDTVEYQDLSAVDLSINGTVTTATSGGYTQTLSNVENITSASGTLFSDESFGSELTIQSTGDVTGTISSTGALNLDASGQEVSEFTASLVNLGTITFDGNIRLSNSTLNNADGTFTVNDSPDLVNSTLVVSNDSVFNGRTGTMDLGSDDTLKVLSGDTLTLDSSSPYNFTATHNFEADGILTFADNLNLADGDTVNATIATGATLVASDLNYDSYIDSLTNDGNILVEDGSKLHIEGGTLNGTVTVESGGTLYLGSSSDTITVGTDTVFDIQSGAEVYLDANFFDNHADPTFGGQLTYQNTAPNAVADSASATEDNAVTINVLSNDTDDQNNTLSVSNVGTVSNGTAVINGDNTITYTPDANFNGTETFTYTASDGNGGTATETVTVTVSAENDIPTVLADTGSANEDNAVTINVLSNDSDVDGDSLSVSGVGTVTNGTAVVNNDNTITYTPDANFNGTETFTYTASDGNGGTATETVTVTVDAANDIPTVVADTGSTTEDNAVTINVLSNDSNVDGDTLSVSSLGTVTNGTAVVNNDNTITYTPDPNFNGTETFTYTASDGNGGTATETVTVTVSAENDIPTVVADTGSTTEDNAVTINVLSNDSDVDGDTLSVSSVGTVANGTAVVNNDNTITYTPDANFNGTETFTYTASDGNGGTATETVTVTVGAENDIPTLVADTGSTTEDNAVTINVLSNDSDVDGDTLSVSSVGSFSNGGSAVINGDNTITYTPATNFNGTETFTYTASDGNGGTATETVTVTVGAENDIPTAVADTGSTTEDNAVTINVLSNDSDVDGDTLSVSSVGTVANGTAVVNNDNTITYTPDANFNGTETFTYTASDGNGGTATETVTVTVSAENDAPDAVDDTATTDEGSSVTIDVLSNDTDVEGDTLTVSGTSNVTNGTAVVNGNNTIDFTPDAEFTGTTTFDYTISDGNGGTDTATATVTVNATETIQSLDDGTIDLDSALPDEDGGTITSTNVSTTSTGYTVTAFTSNGEGGIEAGTISVGSGTAGAAFGIDGVSSAGVDPQIGYDIVNGVSEELRIDFDYSVSTVTVGISNLFLSAGDAIGEGTDAHEQGHWAAYKNGSLVSEADFVATTGTNQATLNISVSGGFDKLVFSATEYAGGQTATSNTSDYWITSVAHDWDTAANGGPSYNTSTITDTLRSNTGNNIVKNDVSVAAAGTIDFSTTNASTLTLEKDLANAGLIEIATGSLVSGSFSTMNVDGIATNSGTIDVDGGNTFNVGTGTLTNTGVLTTGAYADASNKVGTFSGDVVNSTGGTITSVTDMKFTESLTSSGGNIAIGAGSVITVASSFIIASSATVNGSGSLSLGDAAHSIATSQTLTLDTDVTTSVAGTLTVEDSATLLLNGTLQNDGMITAGTASLMTFGNDAHYIAGSYDNSGDIAHRDLDFSNGTIAAAGTVEFRVDDTHSTSDGAIDFIQASTLSGGFHDLIIMDDTGTSTYLGDNSGTAVVGLVSESSGTFNFQLINATGDGTGSSGNDYFAGSSGNDTASSGSGGTDLFYGYAGNDTFTLSNSSFNSSNVGYLDGGAGGTDTLILDGVGIGFESWQVNRFEILDVTNISGNLHSEDITEDFVLGITEDSNSALSGDSAVTTSTQNALIIYGEDRTVVDYNGFVNGGGSREFALIDAEVTQVSLTNIGAYNGTYSIFETENAMLYVYDAGA